MTKINSSVRRYVFCWKCVKLTQDGLFSIFKSEHFFRVQWCVEQVIEKRRNNINNCVFLCKGKFLSSFVFEAKKKDWSIVYIPKEMCLWIDLWHVLPTFLLSSIYIRRKYWILEIFRLLVFNGFTCFEMSWTRFDHF